MSFDETGSKERDSKAEEFFFLPSCRIRFRRKPSMIFERRKCLSNFDVSAVATKRKIETEEDSERKRKSKNVFEFSDSNRNVPSFVSFRSNWTFVVLSSELSNSLERWLLIECRPQHCLSAAAVLSRTFYRLR